MGEEFEQFWENQLRQIKEGGGEGEVGRGPKGQIWIEHLAFEEFGSVGTRMSVKGWK